jgi:hypothetical protein
MRLTHALLPWLNRAAAGGHRQHRLDLRQPAVPRLRRLFGAKAGLRGFSQALRRELADTRSRSCMSRRAPSPRRIEQRRGECAEPANSASHSDSPEDVARQIVAALRAGRGERHFGFPERLFAWLNGVAPALIDQALAGKLAIVKRHATLPDMQNLEERNPMNNSTHRNP